MSSRDAFFRRGLTEASFKLSGKVLMESDTLVNSVRRSKMDGSITLISSVGIMSDHNFWMMQMLQPS